ncbi:MAG: transposase [Spongiibacter sp.]|nr:transposase [Spongiibacter sp.]
MLSQEVAVEIDGRCVLLGDHTYVVKDGGRMPGVVSLHEHSETQRKPSYFRGQCWGALGLVVGTLTGCFCLPLELRIHQGFVHLGQTPQTGGTSRTSLGERVVEMALAFACAHDRPAWLVLDAFFPTAKVFLLARSVYSIALQQPYLHVLVRAKKHYVAYFPAPPKPPHRRGRPPRYGQKIHLWECFDHRHLFDTVYCQVYGQREAVQVLALPLLWKPLGDWLLFIFAITSRGPLVLMASDLNLAPTTALELYCVRTRIEIMFDVMKNLLHAFCFRFWTPSLPRHPRRPRANRDLQAPAAAQVSTVKACWQAYETFVLCAAIAHGLLQLIALRFGALVWQHHRLYLRTQSRALPSEKTVKQVLAPRLIQQFIHLPQISILQKIQHCLDGKDDDDNENDRWVA